ncbi:MAG TPA: hypothetical protein VF785_25670 [Gemmatimonadaceae bacterium]
MLNIRRKIHTLAILVAAATMGAACNRYTQNSSAGTIDPADAKNTVVLHVQNMNTSPMELRTVLNGRTQFVGSVGGNDSISLLLDPTMFPTGLLYVVAIPTGGRGRAVAGPLSAGRGDRIDFTIEPALDQSHAIVIP